MELSKDIAGVLSLGIITAMGGVSLAEGSGDPRVRVIELLGDSGYPELGFSGQGDTISLRHEISDGAGGVGVELYTYQGQDWELVKRVFGQDFFALRLFGISDDGTKVAETDYENVNLIEGTTSTVFSRNWHDIQSGVSRWHMQGEALSGDGQRVGVTGTPADEMYSDALLWDGESRFINLSWDLEQERKSYAMRGLSFDGTVAVFGAIYQAPHNNIRFLNAEHDVWVWEADELTMVPPVAAGYEVEMVAVGVSSDGQAVIGRAGGSWRSGFDDERSITDAQVGIQTIHGPSLAWVWTRDSGTVEIADAAQFESISVWDITDDAGAVLGKGYSPDTGVRQFLWYRDDHRFVMIDELFTKLGITIDADWYSFNQISGDGSKLMGMLNLDGQYSAIIVTIPVRKP